MTLEGRGRCLSLMGTTAAAAGEVSTAGTTAAAAAGEVATARMMAAAAAGEAAVAATAAAASSAAGLGVVSGLRLTDAPTPAALAARHHSFWAQSQRRSLLSCGGGLTRLPLLVRTWLLRGVACLEG